MRADEKSEITGLLLAWRAGDEQALEVLIPRVYRRLKHIASLLMKRERAGHTLVTTALVHEAFLRMEDLSAIDWNDRTHFYSVCARIMRRVLVDHARAANRKKRGGELYRVDTAELLSVKSSQRPADLVALDEALIALAEQDKQMARIVELRFFGGVDREAIAEVTGLSSATVTRRWRAARAWLIDELTDGRP